MIEFIKNKDFSIFIESECTMEDNRIFFPNVHYVMYSTRATKFQMKKAMKRKIHSLLWEHIRRGAKGCSKDDHIESDLGGPEGLSSS